MKIHPKGIALFCAAALLAAAAPAHALRVATWNLLSYDPGNGGVTPRQPYLRTAMASMLPDILISQETNSSAAKDSLLNNVLNVVEPGQWTAAWTDVTGEGMGVYWKPSQVAISNIGAFSTSGPRKVLSCLVKPVGYRTNPGWFRLYSFHLKASNADSSTRRLECTDIRNTINAVPLTVVGPNFLIGGDTNFYGAWEGGYIRLTESQADNDGRCKDFLTMPGTWNNNSAYKLYDTQSACLSCPSVPGILFSGGGMDDRLDMLLSSYSVQDGQGLEMLDHVAFGNDGLHFNLSVNSSNYNGAVGYTVATALYNISDHLPVVSVIRLPAKIAAASQLDFGTVIAGAAAELPLDVSNVAPQPVGYTFSSTGATPLTLPGDTLRYSLAPPAGFTAPPGNFVQPAGDPATGQVVGMSTATAGGKSGALTVATNDPDTLSKSVLLSGRVLDHAQPSLDSLSAVALDTLDFGEHQPAGFGPLLAAVHDLGYGPLRARLSVSAAQVAGGDGRFTLPGFAPALVAGTAGRWAVQFDATGATADSTYEATLTFSSADEPLPGAAARPDVQYLLTARVAADTTVSVGPEAPAFSRLYAPMPNPLRSGSTLRFDLARNSGARLEVFDLSGRRVALLADREFTPGRYSLPWDGRGEGGDALGPGLYFVRLTRRGLPPQTVRLAIVR